MDFFEAVENRYNTVRDFENREVEEEKINKILDAINKSPSAGNLQAYEVFLVKDPQKRSQIARAANNQEFIAKAPVILVFCAHPARCSEKYERRGEQLYCIQDATIAAAHAQLAAAALGLNTRWVGAFDDDQLRHAIGADKSLIPTSVLPIGYWGVKPQPKPRRDLNDLVHRV